MSTLCGFIVALSCVTILPELLKTRSDGELVAQHTGIYEPCCWVLQRCCLQNSNSSYIASVWQAFVCHHGGRLSPFRGWLPERQQEATVEGEVAPESYALVTSEGGTYRRNRQAINKLPDPSPQVETATDTHPASPQTLSRRSSRESALPSVMENSFHGQVFLEKERCSC